MSKKTLKQKAKSDSLLHKSDSFFKKIILKTIETKSFVNNFKYSQKLGIIKSRVSSLPCQKIINTTKDGCIYIKSKVSNFPFRKAANSIKIGVIFVFDKSKKLAIFVKKTSFPFLSKLVFAIKEKIAAHHDNAINK